MRYVLYILTALILLSCGQKKNQEPPKVAVVISTLNNPWFVVLGETAVAEAKKLGYDAKLFDAQNSTAVESDHFENIISAGFDAILFNPTDADGSIANILKAKTAGIPVFCMDREVNSNDAATSQILSDNYSGCVAIGVEFVKTLKEKGNYVEILGLSGDNNTYARSKGFHKVVDRFKGIKMLGQQNGDFDRNKAMDVMESMMQAHPDLQGVFCGNDAMAMGAFQAIQSAGKADQIKVFGFDGVDEVVQKVKEGKIIATGMQYPKVMAKTAAAFAVDYFKGRKSFPQHIPVAVTLVNAQNAKQFVSEK